MIRLIYLLLALLVLGCVRQTNTTHPKDDVAPIDSTLAATDDSRENTMLNGSAPTGPVRTDSVRTDSALTDTMLTDSISANLQRSKIYNEKEIIRSSFYKDTIETALSSGSIKTFLSEDEKEIVRFHKMEDTIWITGTKANAIISNHDRADTITITRSLLAKQFPFLNESDIDIEEYEIVSIYYDYEKGDTICLSIALTIPDTDFGYFFNYYHTNKNDYIEQYYEEWETDEDM